MYEKQLKRIFESDEVQPAEEVKPEADHFTMKLLDAFNDLSSERTYGFVRPDPITIRMCMDYCELHGIAYKEMFYRAMKAADQVWFKYKVKKPKANA